MDPQQQEKWYYRFAIFFVANQTAFKRLGVVLLILVNIGIWWPASVGLIDYFTYTPLHNLMVDSINDDLINWQEIREKNKPLPLQIISVDKIKLANGKYDLVAKVYNPNVRWTSNLKYTFVTGNYAADFQQDFVFPKSYKYLFKFSQSIGSLKPLIDLKIENSGWQKVEDEEKIDLLNNIKISSERFSSKNNFSQLEFTAQNNTTFGFWLTGWQIILYNNSRPTAINYVTTPNYLASENRNISATWTENLSNPSKIEILPDLDIFDQTNYILNSDVPPVNLIRGG